METLRYTDAGVDIDAGDELVERIKPLARKTLREGVLGGIGGFGALFEVPPGYRRPVLVSGTDGVGTKLRLAFAMNRHDTVGIDLVAMSVNDILVQGAEPLFFLDYFACGKLHVDTAASVISGIARGCEDAGCALVGGETAEMPDMYPAGEYDLAGFAVGVVEHDRIIDGKRIASGDVVLGLASSGPHSNGYSLIRKVLERSGATLTENFEGSPLGEVLLKPTRIYVRALRALLAQVEVRGIAHITGGGLVGNIPRVLGQHLSAHLEAGAWPRPAIFEWLRERGNVEEAEMYRVFNCGIGLALVVSAQQAGLALEVLREAGETAWAIGEIRARQGDEPQTLIHPHPGRNP